MKRVLLFIQYLILAIAANATGQEGDIIYIDGAQWELLGRPVCADSLLCHDLEAVLPQERSWTTANWDGFKAYWSIKQDVLYLDSIQYQLYDSVTKDRMSCYVPADTLLRVFRRHVEEGHIMCSWLTRDIRVAKGKVIYYQHMGFERNYEDEQIISIDKGKVTGKKVYHNYVIDGFLLIKLRTTLNYEGYFRYTLNNILSWQKPSASCSISKRLA